MTPRVAIVIVTYQSAPHIAECLRAADRARPHGAPLVVVDNASTDETLEAVREAGVDVELIPNARNVGFAAASNQGIAATESEHILLLNPDTRLSPDAIATLLAHLDRDPRLGIVGPRLMADERMLQADASATGTLPGFAQALFEYTRLGVLFPEARPNREYFLHGWDRTSDRDVAMVQGACFLFRRQLVEELGPLDDGYFLYFEETDFCARARAAGWRVGYVGSARCVHLGGRSMPEGRQSAPHFIRSLYRYHAKHHGPLEATVLWGVLAPYHAAKVARLAAVARRRPDDAKLRSDLRTARERLAAHLAPETLRVLWTTPRAHGERRR